MSLTELFFLAKCNAVKVEIRVSGRNYVIIMNYCAQRDREEIKKLSVLLADPSFS